MFSVYVEQIIRDAAKRSGIEEAALLALIETESAGEVAWDVNGKKLPAIRFEGHYFYARLSGDKLKLAIAQGLAAKKAGTIANPRSYAARYALLEKARAIDSNAADESTSWGLGQVMGANWKDLGYNSVSELVKAAQTGEGQVDMMVRFIKANDLLGPLKARDWASVARTYNGPAYTKNKYDTKMAQAYARYSAGAKVDLAPVKQMQAMLNIVGDYKLTLDGVLGDNTSVALRDFQLKNGLVVDGKYGPITKETLEKAYVAKTTANEQKTGGLTGAAGLAGTAITEAAKQIEPLSTGSVVLQFVFVGLILLGVFFTVRPLIWGNK
jgi:hypothetical protein